MTTRKPSRILTSSIAALAAVTAFSPSSTEAASGSWNVDAAGNWGTAANWSPAAIPGTVAGDVITLGNVLTAARIVTIDTTSRTAGDLNIGSSAAFGFTLASSAATVVLNLDGTGSADATVDFTANANTISAPITLVDNGIFRSNIAAIQTLSGIISGAKTVTYNNDTNGTVNAAGSGLGLFTVSGANTYSLGTSISDVRVTITTSNAALGTGAVTIAAGGQVYNSTGLTAIANTFNINGNGWAEAAAGAPFGALRLEGASIVTGNVVMQSNSSIGSNTGTGAVTGTVNGVVSGAFQLTKVGVGTLALGGANTFNGGLLIANGSVQLNNNSGAGTGAISFATGGATNPTRLLVNGGVTANNPININVAMFGVAGNGALQQTGTGLATLNGPINITAGPTAGGHFVGGGAATNALVLNGAITSTVGVSQREGFVRYGGGGTGYNSLTVTNTAIVGATNGISTTAGVILGGSGNALLDMNGFDQTLASVSLGNAGLNSALRGSIALGAKTLTLNGDLTTLNTGTGNAIHSITGTAGTGTINFGSTPRNLAVADSTAIDDLQITGTTLANTGGLTKNGIGTVALNGVTLNGAFTVGSGTVRTGLATQVGSFAAGNITFNNGTTLAMKAGAAGDLITAPNFVNAGTTNLIVNQVGGALGNGDYTLINYSGGTSPGTAGFALAPVGHAAASLFDTGSAIVLRVTDNAQVIWDGTASSAWTTAATGNWKHGATSAATDYVDADDVVFQDGLSGSTADIAANVSPSNVAFSNTTSTAISITGAAGIVGLTGLSKTGNGVLNLGGAHQYGGPTSLSAGTTNLTGSVFGTNITVSAGATLTSTGTIAGGGGLTSSGTTTLRGPSTYTGATSIAAGTLELDHDGGTLTATSGVNVASGATLLLTRDGTATVTTTAFTRNLTGSGNLDINIRTGAVGAVADSVVLSGANAGFSGPIRLLSPATGTYRLSLTAPTQPGTGSIDVQNGTQVFVSGTAATYTNALNITGTGFADSAGNIGALRLDGSTWAGNIVVSGSARIGSHNSTGTISGNISGGNLEFGATNFNNSYTTILTGANTYGTTTIGGQNTQVAGVPSMRVNVGANGASGTLGTGNVIINGDGANGVLGFDRADGYTLLPGQTITGAVGTGTIANSIQRTFIDFDTQGTGFNDNGNSITLGTAAIGGNLRFGQGRANTVSSISGALTAQVLTLGSNQPNATLNLNSGANVNVTTINIGLGTSVNVANTLNINNGSALTAFTLMAGQVSGGIGVINQASGSTVNVDAQLRLGHFPNNTSVYNISGGALNMTGASPNNSPSTAAGGSAGVNGDNNINTLAVAAFVGGGIYLGNDGTGVMNHTGGTVTTNWVVLDNRGASGAGANMPDGIDRYNISGSALLKLRSNWGLLGRNDGSYAVSFGGGTVQVDNTGTGTGTGANIAVPIDAIIDTVAATTTTLDTNGGGNGFTLSKDIRGTGTLGLTGAGAINLSTAGIQAISASLSGANPVNKIGAGTSTLTGASSGYTGPITVSTGRLNVNGALGSASSITVADGATLSGEPTVAALTLGSTAGSTLFFNPTTGAKLTATTLSATSNTVLDFSSPIPGDGTYPVLSFGSKSGAGTFILAGAANYRSAVVNESATAVDVVISNTKSLIWNGTGGATWDVKTTANFEDSGNPGTQDIFYSADVVNFGDADANGNPITPPTAVAVSAGVAPALVQVSGTTNNYTLTSTGAGIASGEIVKDGSTTLTLSGPNTYSGKTTIQGGTVSISNPNSLGNGLPGNSVALSNGGKLTYTGATADLGINRGIAVGSGGGAVAFSSGTAGTLTVSGNLLGNGSLALSSTLAGGGTFALTGVNSGFTGAITVDSLSTGLTTLSIPSAAAVPNASSITVNYPANGATGNATTLTLGGGVSIPATTTVKLNSLLNGALSLRTQVVTTGNASIDGPLTAEGTAIIQFSPPTGTVLTLNGPISAGVSGFNGPSSVFFLRGTGGGVVNGTITLPGGNVSKTDGGAWTINSTGNDWLNTGVNVGTMRLGAAGVLPAGSNLTLGQNDTNTAVLALDGFNQTVGSLASNPTAVGANTTGKSITSATAATLTVNQATTTTYASLLTGATSLVKSGAGSLTLSGASTNTGNIAVNGGTLVATALGAANGANGSLGAANVAGKTVTVSGAGSILSFTSNNIFGNGVGNANQPAITLDGGTVTSTRYNAIGALTLNGGTLTQSATDGPGAYEGFQFRGNVTVGGAAQSEISTGNGKANHLNANTVFTVADATTGVDLLVSAPLKDQSGDFGGTAGGLTKSGPGTMELSATNAYTGATLVTDGVLRVSGSISGSAVTVNGATAVLGGTGTVGATTLLNGGTINAGASPGILNIAGNFAMSSGTNLGAEIEGTTVGAQYDQLSVTGTVTLANATLTLGGSYTNTVAGDLFTIILNDGTSDAVSGTFAGLSEGASILAASSGQEFTISYAGGDGNDVVLTAVPEPGSAVMLLGGVGVLLGLQRRRRNA